MRPYRGDRRGCKLHDNLECIERAGRGRERGSNSRPPSRRRPAFVDQRYTALAGPKLLLQREQHQRRYASADTVKGKRAKAPRFVTMKPAHQDGDGDERGNARDQTSKERYLSERATLFKHLRDFENPGTEDDGRRGQKGETGRIFMGKTGAIPTRHRRARA